jgi:tRNA1Val (adenine37-N6)-methyltransferase
MAFKFKQFAIDDSDCAMKVGTDSVLLGSWLCLNDDELVLDIGTGCGILALMAAQESSASIVALDIDHKAYIQAQANVNSSVWSNRIKCIHSSIQDYSINYNGNLFDHVITNPPYFTNSLKSPVEGRNKARHNDDLPFDSLIDSVYSLLKDGGRLSIVLPFDVNVSFINQCTLKGFSVKRQLTVKPRIDKTPNRILLELVKGNGDDLEIGELSIRDEKGHYTSSYKALTSKYYLNF